MTLHLWFLRLHLPGWFFGAFPLRSGIRFLVYHAPGDPAINDFLVESPHPTDTNPRDCAFTGILGNGDLV